jgi:hypothetical protein
MTARLALILRLTSTLGVMMGLAGCQTPGPSSESDAGFCARAQAAIVSALPPAQNEVFTDFTAFTKSKPAVRPLYTRQFVRLQDGDPQRPILISCKMKTADHLISEYGSGQAGEDRGCRHVNELTLRSVEASLPKSLRRAVIFEEDIVTTDGPVWLAPYAHARLDSSGALHLQSRAMKNDWLDPRCADSSPQLRGTRYCHFIAPEYLRRLLQGEAPQQP